MKKKFSNALQILGGFSGLVILFSFIFIGEFISVLISGDTGALLWTTFHFVINPIVCIFYIALTILKMRRSTGKYRFLYILGVLIAFFYVYIAFTGNYAWVEFFNINF